MPLPSHLAFYADTLRAWVPDRGATILVVGGGRNDRDVLVEAGYTNVTISNLDERMRGDEFAPCAWSRQDMEKLDLPDASFDYVITHAALHHCHSPHRALLEMYRVARIRAIAIEARDSWVMRRAEALGITQRYEVSAVLGSDRTHGGVANSEIPNFVYRWTEREVEKTIATYAPHARHQVLYRYGCWVNPGGPSIPKPMRMVRLALGMLTKAVSLLAPSQGNRFAFCITKPTLPDDLWPWLELRDGKPRFAWRGDQVARQGRKL